MQSVRILWGGPASDVSGRDGDADLRSRYHLAILIWQQGKSQPANSREKWSFETLPLWPLGQVIIIAEKFDWNFPRTFEHIFHIKAIVNTQPKIDLSALQSTLHLEEGL